MVQLQLFIEGQEVELHDNESVTLTQTLQDVLDIQKIYTDYTRTFNVPASKVNNSIFKHFQNPSIVGNNTRGKREAELQLNYKPFRTGRVKLEGAQMKNGSPVNYRLTFFGSTIQLKDIIGEDTLSDLSVLNYNIRYDATTVKNVMQDGVDLNVYGEDITDAFIYPLISSKARLYYDSGEDVAGTYNLDVGTNSHGVPYDELKPAIRLHAIIQAIKQKYNIKFSDDFFNSSNDAYYGLYLWLHKQKGRFLPEGEDSQYELGKKWTITGGGNDDIKRLFLASNYSRFRNADNRSGKRILTASVEAPVGAEYSVRISGHSQVFYEAEHTGDATLISIDDEMYLPKTNYLDNYTEAPLDIVFEIKSTANATFTVNAGVYEKWDFAGMTITQGAAHYATASSQITTQANYYSTSIINEMPNIKVMDFLTSIFKMFNLTAYFINDEVQVLPLDDWYAASDNTFDITKYIDRTQGEINVSYPYSAVKFGYKGVGSFFAKTHEEFFGLEWGGLQYDSTADFSSDTYTIELPFEHHKFERFYDTGTGQYVDAQWGWSVDDKQDVYIGQPLLFYAHKVESGTAISFQETLGGVQHTLTKFYIPSNSVDPTGDTQTIHFGAEMNEFTRESSSKSLFDTYYRSYIEEVYDDSRRLFKYKAYLPLSVISNINLNDKVIIFNDLYKINKMVTNFETGVTDFELINEIQDFDVQVDRLVADTVTTVDQSIVTADNTLVTADTTELRW